VYVGAGWNTTTTFCEPAGAFDGIVNVATTVPCVESEMVVAAMPVSETVLVSVTLVTGALAGGHGGLLGRVMVTLTVCPGLALPPGAVLAVENAVVPAPWYGATAVRPTR
jgi:hypothetical protein